jgi:hypothetical protein
VCSYIFGHQDAETTGIGGNNKTRNYTIGAVLIIQVVERRLNEKG